MLEGSSCGRGSTPPIATPLKELLDSLAAKCADWRKSDEDLTAENAARALAVCNELAPERVLSARVPGLETSVMLDVPSAAIGAGFGVLVILASTRTCSDLSRPAASRPGAAAHCRANLVWIFGQEVNSTASPTTFQPRTTSCRNRLYQSASSTRRSAHSTKPLPRHRSSPASARPASKSPSPSGKGRGRSDRRMRDER